MPTCFFSKEHISDPALSYTTVLQHFPPSSNECLVLTKSNCHHASLQPVTFGSLSPARSFMPGNTAGRDASEPGLLQCSRHGSGKVSIIFLYSRSPQQCQSSNHLTYFPIPSLLDRAPGTSDDIWCAPSSSTWVLLTFGKKLTGTTVTELLIDSYNQVGEALKANGDGPIIKGVFQLTRYGLLLAAKNANNHQLTRGVLEAAITATWQYMRSRQYGGRSQGTVTFQIFDGLNQVGIGSIQRASKSSGPS